MAAIKVNLIAVVMAVVFASMQFQDTVAQTTHVVGDAFGWNIPSGGASDYTTWASRQSFTVSDVLLFNFTTGHTVAEVAQAAYGPCTTANLISIATSGPARITLNAAGAHYYICTVGTHCQLGQKLTVNVSGASATPAPAPATLAPVSPPTTATPTPSPTPSTTVSPPTSSPASSPSGSTTSPTPSGSTTPPPSGSSTPSPTGSATPPPPADSFAPSFIAALPITFLAMALAFFY